MKLLVVVLLVAAASAAPQRGSVRYSPGYDAQIIFFDNDYNYGRGDYRYAFEQTDGTKQDVRGEVRNEGREDEFVAVKGSYSYVGADDVEYTVNYTADEGGFQPDIQQGPGGGVPPAVVASLLG